MKAFLAVAAATLVALPAAAQHDRHQPPEGTPPAMQHRGPMAPGGGMAMPLMRELRFWRPQALLARRERLALTDPQAARLTAIGEEVQQAHQRSAEEAERHWRQAAEAWDSGDSDAAVRHATAGMQAQQQAHAAMLGAAGASRAVLTDEQRARVEGWIDVGRMQRMHGPSRMERRYRRPPRGGPGPRRGR